MISRLGGLKAVNGLNAMVMIIGQIDVINGCKRFPGCGLSSGGEDGRQVIHPSTCPTTVPVVDSETLQLHHQSHIHVSLFSTRHILVDDLDDG